MAGHAATLLNDGSPRGCDPGGPSLLGVHSDGDELMEDAKDLTAKQDQDAFEKVEREALEKGRAAKRARPKRRAKAAPKAKAAAVEDPALTLLSVETTPDPVPAPDTPVPDLAVVREEWGEPGESIPKNPEGLQAALRGLGLELRYNIRGATAEWKGRDIRHMPNDVWSAANDRVDSFIRESIATQFVTGPKNRPAKFGRETWGDSVDALCYLRECDPFLDWLLDLPGWDGTKRLDHWLEDVFTVRRSPLVAWVSRFLLLGPVARAFRPGLKLDESPVLAGPQGCGKSTALRMLLPEDQPGWFADGLHLAAADQKRAEALQGRVIVEASEMAGSNRAELESLKAFLTRTDDGSVRLAYRRNPETMRRRCIIVGTTNSSESLPNDVTGNRRFVVIDVGPGLDGVPGLRSYLDTNRPQLWAEALVMHAAGEMIRLPDALAAEQAEANERHRRSDSTLEDAVAMLKPRTDAKLRELMVAADVVSVGGTSDRRMELRFANALRMQGWVKRHTDKGPRWFTGQTDMLA